MFRRSILALIVFFASSQALAGLSVIATVPDLKAIAQEVAGTDAEVEAFASGSGARVQR